MRRSKDLYYLIAIAVLIGVSARFYYVFRYLPARQIEVFYNQDIRANQKVMQVIRDADQFAYFAVYTFTREDLKDALLGAKRRGLNVRGITDREQTEKIDLQKKNIKALRDAGIPVAVQDHLGIMHLKTLVTDKGYASGSYNWTGAATDLNDEVLEIGRDQAVRSQYQKVLEELLNKYGPSNDATKK